MGSVVNTLVPSGTDILVMLRDLHPRIVAAGDNTIRSFEYEIQGVVGMREPVKFTVSVGEALAFKRGIFISFYQPKMLALAMALHPRERGRVVGQALGPSGLQDNLGRAAEAR